MRRMLAVAALLLLAAAPVAAHGLATSHAVIPATATQPAVHVQLPAAWDIRDPLFVQPEASVPAKPLQGGPAFYSADAAGEYLVTFRCPGTVGSEAGISSTQCPAFLLDPEDIMAQPVLVVDRKDPDKVAFHALHGGPGARLPAQGEPFTDASRDDYLHQPHTVFQSEDGGVWWDDNRYYSPMHDSYPDIFGEDNAAAIDNQGNLLITSLYSYREASDGPLSFVMFNWQSEAIDTPFEHLNGPVRRGPRDPTAAIHEVHTVFERSTRSIATLWLEEGADGRRYVEGDHVVAGEGSWDAIANPVRLGPCSDMTNVVASSGQIYVGCVAAEGYPLPDGAAHGQLMIHRYDPVTWNHTWVGVAPVPTGAASSLAAADAWTERGLAVAGAALEGGVPSVSTSLGIDGKQWSATAQYGDRLSDRANRNGAVPVEVRINALAYVPSSGSLHFVYFERYASAQSGDPGTAATPAVGPSPYFKTYGVAHASGQFLGSFRFGYGDPQTRANFAARTQGPTDAAFEDQHDSIVVVPRGHGERIFFAAGDHGYVRFAEIQEDNSLPPPAPLAAAPPPIPAPITTLNPALVGSVAGALSLSVVGRMAAARNKKTAEAPA